MVDPSRHQATRLNEHGERVGLSGLTEAEAREFHGYFVKSFLGFLAIAVVAHVLTYAAMPWGLHG